MRRGRGALRGIVAAGVAGGVLMAGFAAPASARVNDFACKPPARHPYPVVILHGTFGDVDFTIPQIVPALERLGYCTFAVNYGNRGTGDIPTSGRQVQAFVDQVLARTGARRVSFVGHSQGGMLARYYVKFLGGQPKTDDVVGLSPSSRGTTTPLAAGAPGCTACQQQAAGSPFMQMLNSGDLTPPPASYTVIETRYDEVVTPYESEFLPPTADGRVTNILLQDQCPANTAEHVGIIFDPVALQWMLNALGRRGPADPGYRVDCTGARLRTFPDSNSGTVPEDGGGSGSTTAAPRARLAWAAIAGAAAARGRREIRYRLLGNGRRVRFIAVALRRGSARGTRVGTGIGRIALRFRRTVIVRLTGPLAPGSYVLIARGRDNLGRIVTATRTLRVR